MPALVEFSRTAGTALLQATWQASVLAVIVAVVCRVGRSAIPPAWRFALWGLVFVRLACPVVPVSEWSVFNLTSMLHRTVPAENPGKTEVLHTTPPPLADHTAEFVPHEPPAEARMSDPRSVPSVRVGVSDVEPVLNLNLPIGSARLGGDGHSIRIAALAVWCLVAAWLLMRQAFQAWSLRRLAQSWRPVVDPERLSLFRDCCSELRLRRAVELAGSSDGTGPATLGFVRPKIVIPFELLNSLHRNELRLVLQHELQHVRRHDVLWDRLASIITALHWFNPLGWWALRCLRDEREAACDAGVLHCATAEMRQEYGHLILKLTAIAAKPTQCATAVGIFSRGRSVNWRITMIASCRPTTRRGVIAGLIVVTGLAVCCLTDAAIGPTPQDVTIHGKCVDARDRPLGGINVTLYRVVNEREAAEQLAVRTTIDDGSFEFRSVPQPPAQADRDGPAAERWWYLVAAQGTGWASCLERLSSVDSAASAVSFRMLPSAALVGRVTNSEGHPVAGAKVGVTDLPNIVPGVDVNCSTTDDDGRFRIADMAPCRPKQVTGGESGGTVDIKAVRSLSVQHRDYLPRNVSYWEIPSTVDIVLEAGAVVDGRVIEHVSGQVVPDAVVTLRVANPGMIGGDVARSRTDAEGRYRFSAVKPGRYNIWADTPNRTCVAVDSFELTPGDRKTAPDVELFEGGWIEGRVVDAVNGKAMTQSEDGQGLWVGLHGPARPKSGTDAVYESVDEHGYFRLRAAPGVNYPFLATRANEPLRFGRLNARVEHAYELSQQGISVADGEVVSVVFRVLPVATSPSPVFAAVRLQLPVPEERDAAAAIRRLSGSYELDAERHVIEVNMMHHTQHGVRHETPGDTDEVLQWLPSFPRLERLFLKERQATDDGLRHVNALKELEILYIWDAPLVTDRGVAHLRGLTKLREIQIFRSQIGDGALEVLAALPNLEMISLQESSFTDEGLKRLGAQSRLRGLFVGLSKTPFTDAAVPSLLALTSLQRLDLQGSHISEDGLKRLLGALPNLQELYFTSDRVPTATVKQLKEQRFGATKSSATN
jgi:beta-lactamase regulating signal transducer with metallopeptidase domain